MFLIIIIVIAHRPCRTVANLLTCNTSIITGVYFISNLILSIYGLHEDWAVNQLVCTFRAYSFLMVRGSICYAYLIQVISRLLFTVLSKYKYLVTYRVHWSFIALNWIIGILFSIEPFFFDGGFGFEKESRLCILTSKTISTFIYGIVIEFMVPLSISFVIYGIIFQGVHKSPRRIFVSTSETGTSQMPSARREIKIIKNMIMLEGIFGAGGTLFLTLVLWHILLPSSSPSEALYFLSINSMSLSIGLMMIAIFALNKQVKNIALGYIRSDRQRIHPVVTGRQQQLQLTRN
ncbi:unnamed protein product [Rotaria socialis]|uniref:G-protein coupled receptors family 1 profile domain-containing protein n=1 Tax=Rotaria socialis TaxID=392032 RepID=A0A821KX24_9BILA|nr:unnamed protein product [Rotaria socialis]CAF4742760.1 unnamed protein product [Rotaria socialis]